jgi:hypothetical protein
MPGTATWGSPIELRGDLAGILAFSQTAGDGSPAAGRALQIKMVAGARNRHYLLFNAYDLESSPHC